MVKLNNVCRPAFGVAKPTQLGNADCEPAHLQSHAAMGAGNFLPTAGTPCGVTGRDAHPLQHHCVAQGFRERIPLGAWSPSEQQAPGFGPAYEPGGSPTAAGKSVLRHRSDDGQPQHADQAVFTKSW